VLAGEDGWAALEAAGPPGRADGAGRVRLHRYPLDWLRAGGLWQAEGAPPNVCVLDPRPPRVRELLQAAPGPLICDDRAHAAEVHRLTRWRPKLPEVHVSIPAPGPDEARA